MPVPDLRGVAEATASENATAIASILKVVNASDVANRGARKFGNANALLSASTGLPRATPAKKEAANGLQNRQSCPSGTAFYSCSNGFVGCCNVDPCDPEGGCPEGGSMGANVLATQTSTIVVVTTMTPEASTTGGTVTGGSTQTSTTATHVGNATSQATKDGSITSQATTSGVTTAANSQSQSASIVTASGSGGNGTSTSSSTPTTAASTSASPAPACPAANGTTFTDSSNIAYKIYCDADNTYSSDNTVQVGTGGYGECFTACSYTTSCAGFTYVGLDSGSCYLKAQLPSDNFVAKNGSNYISCSKVNATAVASLSGASSSAISSASGAKKTSAGAIAGGVFGGLAGLAIVLLLIALVARHRRKQIEERRATVTHVIHGPFETQTPPMTSNTPSRGGHARSGSTAHDAFAPFGSSYYPPAHTRQRSVQVRSEMQWV